MRKKSTSKKEKYQLKNKMLHFFEENKKEFWKIVFVDFMLVLVAFSYVGIYSVRTDTAHYVNQILVFREDIRIDNLVGPFREMFYYKISKPIYGVIGATIFRGFSPENSILFTNLFFLLALSFSTYYFLSVIGFNKYFSFVGSIWVSASYPVLKYGLALVTDMSGWFFLVLTVAVFLDGFKKKSIKMIIAASILGFIGSITKETGVLGLVFAGIYLILNYFDTKGENFWRYMAALCAPFFLLQIPFMFYIKSLNGPSEIEWIKFNYRIFFQDFYKLKYFLTNEFLAFGVVWLFFLVGLYKLYKTKEFGLNKTGLYLSAMPGSALLLLWPVFYYRILFAQLVLVLPLAVLGFEYLFNKYEKEWQKKIVLILACVPPILSVVLFLLIKKY